MCSGAHVILPGSLRRQPGGRVNRMQRMRHPTSRTRWRTGRRCSSTSDATPRAAPPSRPRIRELQGRDTVGTAATAFVGIDVSEATPDGCLLTPDGKARDHAFPNGPGGFAALLAWADRHAGGAGTHFAMEATGGYEGALATHLHTAGRTAGVVNPTRIKYAGVM